MFDVADPQLLAVDDERPVAVLDAGLHRADVRTGLLLRNCYGDCVLVRSDRREVALLGGLGPEHLDRPRVDHLLVVEELRGVGTDLPHGLDSQHRVELREPAAVVLLADVDPKVPPVREGFDVRPRRFPLPGERVVGEL